MHTAIDPRKVQSAVHIQRAYTLLCLLYRPLSRIILTCLSDHPAFRINNAQLVLLVNRLGTFDRMISQSEVSVMISQLRKKGIILSERDGKQIYYAVNTDRIAQITTAISCFLYSK